MKLHSVEITNLNSLYDTHRVDLDKTLQGASLFLIWGPTGSGKSTLMDAVSLALFGVTPRLDAERGETTADPRAIMSRGTGACRAAVVFSKLEPGGRATYRAAWACWRARSKPGARLQKPERSLEALVDGVWVTLTSSVKDKEFQPVFNRVLEDFGVGDFNRSMLLAQGQFDAFLGAPARERAAILERLTDTSTYKELGERAARMHGRHRQRLTLLDALAKAGGGLDDQALAALQALHADQTTAVQALQADLDRAVAERDWLQREAALAADLEQAQAKAELARTAQAEAAPLLQALSEHERCEAAQAFAHLDARDAAVRDVAAVQEQLKALAEALPELQDAATSTTKATGEAEGIHLRAAARLEGLRPLVAEAEGALERAEEAGRAALTAQAKAAEAEELAKETQVEVDAAKAALAAAEQAAVEARADLEAHPGDAAFEERWQDRRSRLDQRVAGAARAAADQQELDSRNLVLTIEGAELGSRRSLFDLDREQALAPHQQRLEQCQQALQALLGDAELEPAQTEARRALEAATLRLTRLQAAVAPVEAAAAAALALARLDEGLADVAEDPVVVAALETARQRVVEAADAAERAAAACDRTHRVAALAEHRHALREPEPCPLCGSPEHPWAHDPERAADDERVHALLQEADRDRDDAAAALKQRREELAAKEAAELTRRTQRDLLAHQRELEGANHERLQAAAQAVWAPTGLPSPVASEALAEATKASQVATSAAQAQATALEDAQRGLEAAETVLRRQTAHLEEQDKALAGQQLVYGERRKQLDADRAAFQAQETLREAGLAACADELQSDGLPVEGSDPTVWRQAGDQRVALHRARLQHRELQDVAVTTRRTELEGRARLLEDRSAQAAQLRTAAGEARDAHDLAREAAGTCRAALDAAWDAARAEDPDPPPAGPDDAPPAEREAAWKARVAAAAAAVQAAESHKRDASALLQQNLTRQEASREEEGRAELRRSAADTALNAALISLALPDAPALVERRLDPGTRAEHQRRRETLQAADVAAKTLLGERRAHVDAHALLRPPTLPESPDLPALLETITARSEERSLAAQTLQGSTDALRDHEHAVQAKAKARRDLRQAEQEAAVWQALHDCIGVNDGDRFKEFAQALNLGQLLDKANVHLARLSRRYTLVPRLEGGLPTLEFDLSDLWQVGERVAPRSLSGGERFLVSLSLALGLSDFRSVRMPIETLLLDEGFGTLDPATLDVALAALLQLQADGRQVGIISHVAGLQEQIQARVEVRPLGGGRSTVSTTAD